MSLGLSSRNQITKVLKTFVIYGEIKITMIFETFVVPGGKALSFTYNLYHAGNRNWFWLIDLRHSSFI